MRKSSTDWPALLEQHKASGLSQKAFCRQEGVALSTFTYWMKKTNGKASHNKRGNFIELDLLGESGPAAAPADGRIDLIVELPCGVVMRFCGATR
jgi:hypothetical protein